MTRNIIQKHHDAVRKTRLRRRMKDTSSEINDNKRKALRMITKKRTIQHSKDKKALSVHCNRVVKFFSKQNIPDEITSSLRSIIQGVYTLTQEIEVCYSQLDELKNIITSQEEQIKQIMDEEYTLYTECFSEISKRFHDINTFNQISNTMSKEEIKKMEQRLGEPVNFIESGNGYSKNCFHLCHRPYVQ